MHVQEVLDHSVRRKCGVVYMCFDLFVVVSLYADCMHLNFSLCILVYSIEETAYTHVYTCVGVIDSFLFQCVVTKVYVV